MKRSFYATLPAAVRTELDNRLIDNGYSGYTEIKEWLATEGCEVSEQTILKHAEKLRSRLEDLKLQNDYRRAYGEEISDDIQVNAVNLIATAQRVVQILIDRLETRVIKLQDNDASDTELAIVTNLINKAVSSIGTLNNTQVVASKYLDDARAKQEAKFAELQLEGQSRGIDSPLSRYTACKLHSTSNPLDRYLKQVNDCIGSIDSVGW